jgi:transposase
MECEAGQELQVDFGQGAWVVENGKRRRPHLFRGVLSHSRKGYSEAVWRQTSESFIRCLENAFRHFGGVTATVVIDYVPGHIIDVLFPATICARLARPRCKSGGE